MIPSQMDKAEQQPMCREDKPGSASGPGEGWRGSRPAGGKLEMAPLQQVRSGWPWETL